MQKISGLPERFNLPRKLDFSAVFRPSVFRGYMWNIRSKRKRMHFLCVIGGFNTNFLFGR